MRDAFEPSKGSGAAIRIWTWAEGVSAMLGSIGERVGDGGDEVVGVVTGEGVGTRACQKWVAVVAQGSWRGGVGRAHIRHLTTGHTSTTSAPLPYNHMSGSLTP